ncbi:MAG TPA: methyl-accepting chemotaxis protein [Kofleriaceae bacterium]
MKRIGQLSVRTKLVLVIGASLTAISLFMLAFFPPRMESISRKWAERRALDVSIVVAEQIKSQLAFESDKQAGETLAGLRTAGDTVYAVALKSDRTLFAGWNQDKAPPLLGVPDLPVVTANRGNMLDVAVPLKLPIGAPGVLLVGFSTEAAVAEARDNRNNVLIAAALVFAIGLALSFVTGTLITRPIVSLRHATERIVSAGDLTQKIEIHSRDEVGELAATFAQMVERLRSVPISMRESAELLTKTVERLSASTAEQGEAVTRQAAGLQETQVTAQEIRQTSLMAAQKAQGILLIAERAEDVSASGEKAIEESRRGLNEIRSLVDEIAAKINQLGERTHQIGTITEAVKDLADQSNMLALNAAIEAVRSGEHGRAFAVVAREIRALADQSIQSTNRARDILEDIGGAVREAVAITEKGAQRMEAGLIQVQRSGENLRELSGMVKESSSAVRQIAAAVAQQNAGISQIFTAVTDLSQLMDETVKGLRETDQSVGILKDVTQRVASVVNSFRV